MIEVPQEQLTTIYELANQAAGMARAAWQNAANPSQTSDIDAILPASPLAAEIFKTLVRCHVQAKTDRAVAEAEAAMRKARPEGAMVQGSPFSPPSGMGRI